MYNIGMKVLLGFFLYKLCRGKNYMLVCIMLLSRVITVKINHNIDKNSKHTQNFEMILPSFVLQVWMKISVLVN